MVLKTIKSDLEMDFQMDLEEYLGHMIKEWTQGGEAEEAVRITEQDSMNLARHLWRNLWFDKLKKSTVLTVGDGHELDNKEVDVEMSLTGNMICGSVLDPEPEQYPEGSGHQYPAEGYGWVFELYKGEMRMLIWAGGDDPDWNGEDPTHTIPFRTRRGELPEVRDSDED
jgi:hypothetical protein